MSNINFNDYIQDILSNLPNSIYWKNKEGVYLGANIHAVRMVGFKSVNDIIGKTDYDFSSKEKADNFRKNDILVLTTGKEICVEEESYSKMGTKLIQLSTKKPIRDSSGNIIGVMGVTVDITDLKKKEEQLVEQTKFLEEALSEKKRFLNNLSHEIRTPLHIISSISEALYKNINSISKDQFQGFLSTLLKNNKRLMTLVTNLLEVAKGAQRKNEYCFEKRNIITTVYETISEFEPIILISLKTAYKSIVANIDELKISQVMRNIVNNAVKYGKNEPIVVEIKKIENIKKILIKITNKSIGIIKEEREKFSNHSFKEAIIDQRQVELD